MCSTTPGQQHVRDYPVTGWPASFSLACDMGIGELLRRKRDKLQTQLTNVAGATGDYVTPWVLSPERLRVRVTQRQSFTVFNTGTTVARITAITSTVRQTLNASRPYIVTEMIPVHQVGGPQNGSSSSTVTTVPSIMGWAPPAKFIPLPYSSGDYGKINTECMSTNLLGVSTTAGSDVVCLRAMHAKMQFNPWIKPRINFLYGSAYGVVQTRSTPMGMIPASYAPAAATVPAGNSLWTSQMSYRDQSTPMYDNADNSSAFGIPGNPAVGFSQMPQYKEEKKGYIDKAMKRHAKKFSIQPGGHITITFPVYSRVINPTKDGFFTTIMALQNSTPQSIASNAHDRMGELYKSAGMDGVMPQVNHTWGGVTKILSLLIKGNTAVTKVGAAAGLMNECGPAVVMVKKHQHTSAYAWETALPKMPNRTMVTNSTDTSITPSEYLNTFITSAPVGNAPFTSVLS